jgi:hypothetical protein
LRIIPSRVLRRARAHVHFVWCFNRDATVTLVPAISTFRDSAVVSGWFGRQAVRRARAGDA